MCKTKIVLVLGFLLQTQISNAIWSCSSSEDCSTLSGGVCDAGECVCPAGQQQTLAGTLCADVAPYFTSPCVEDFQCSRFFTGYACTTEGTCGCQPEHHYFHGRCWPTRGFGDSCSRDEECQSILLDPHAMSCGNGICGCAQGYYLRQNGECRRSGLAPGDGCVLDADCQFENGFCDRANLTCVDNSIAQLSSDVTVPTTFTQHSGYKLVESNISALAAGVVCRENAAVCQAPYQCSSGLNVCICPLGYYPSEDGTQCYAELGSPATNETCVGLFATVEDGVCSCPANFYYDVNMRDCVKATLRFTDSCISDQMCHTFGAASVCGPAQEPWGLRSCECIPDLAVWDEQQTMCRVFVGIGETCEVDSDCLAGLLDILCLADDEGTRRCTCPEGLIALDGLCIDTGLVIGESCQVSQECSGTDNTVCSDGVCSCADGYQLSGDVCAPVIGSACSQDADCVIPHTVCATSLSSSTCQCREGFVEHEDSCWIESSGYNASCEVPAQCTAVLGSGSTCSNEQCFCDELHHYRNERCWPRTGLFETCSRNSECYLGPLTDRVVCRNALCQCDFHYPYSEELRSCLSGSSSTIGNIILVFTAITYLLNL